MVTVFTSSSSTDQLTDWLIDWPTDWWIDRLMDWQTDWLAYWLTDLLTDWRTDRWMDWLTNWLTYWLIDWQRIIYALHLNYDIKYSVSTKTWTTKFTIHIVFLPLHQSLSQVLDPTNLECIAQAANVVLQPLLSLERLERLESHKTARCEKLWD